MQELNDALRSEQVELRPLRRKAKRGGHRRSSLSVLVNLGATSYQTVQEQLEDLVLRNVVSLARCSSLPSSLEDERPTCSPACSQLF